MRVVASGAGSRMERGGPALLPVRQGPGGVGGTTAAREGLLGGVGCSGLGGVLAQPP